MNVSPDLTIAKEPSYKKPRMKSKGSVNNSKEFSGPKIKQLKNIKTSVSRFIDEPALQYLFLKEEDIERSSSSSNEEDLNKVNQEIIRKTIQIRKQVKNQFTQTDDKNNNKRGKKRGSIGGMGQKKSFKMKSRQSINVLNNDASQSDIDNQSMYDENEYEIQEKVLINKELMSMIKELLSKSPSKSPTSKMGKLQKVNATSKKHPKSKNSKNSPKSNPEMGTFTLTEVRTSLKSLYQKLLICLNDEGMKKRFDESFNTAQKAKVSDFTSLLENGKTNQEVFHAKLSVYKTLVDKSTKIYLKCNDVYQMEKMMLGLFKSNVVKE